MSSFENSAASVQITFFKNSRSWIFVNKVSQNSALIAASSDYTAFNFNGRILCFFIIHSNELLWISKSHSAERVEEYGFPYKGSMEVCYYIQFIFSLPVIGFAMFFLKATLPKRLWFFNKLLSSKDVDEDAFH